MPMTWRMTILFTTHSDHRAADNRQDNPLGPKLRAMIILALSCREARLEASRAARRPRQL
eukprot:422590-Hanusia_phi.AAC.3